MQDLSIGILFGILSMVGYGLEMAICQPLIRKIGAAKAIFFRNIIIVALLLAAFIFIAQPFSFDPVYLLLAFAIALFGYLPVMVFYKALKTGDVGVVAPISSSAVIITVMLSIAFFGEKLSTLQSASIILIIFGIFLLSANPKSWKDILKSKAAPGVAMALLASLLWGIVYFLIKIPVNSIGPLLTSFILELGVLLASAAHVKFSKSDFSFDKSNGAAVLLIGITGAAGTLFYTLGISISNVSVVAAISMSAPLVSALYGRIFFNERLAPLQWLSVGLVILGVALLQLA